jgi:hypothetical protein
VKVLRSCENDPAGCVRHRLDDDWNAGDKPVAPAPSSADLELAPSKDQIMADEESYVLNQVTNMCAVGNACSFDHKACGVSSFHETKRRLRCSDVACRWQLAAWGEFPPTPPAAA